MRFLSCFAICVLLLAGCGSTDPGTNPAPQLTLLEVTMGGQPVNDVKFNFQPVGSGLPAVVEIKNGKGEFEVTPGEYTYFISAGKSDATLKKVPEKYLTGALDRKFEVKGGESLQFTLD